jgi:phasin family protein
MFDPKMYTFDVERMMELFKNNEFTKQLSAMKLPEFDSDALMKTQQKNMEALVRANQAAAAGYQELFKKQMSIYEETMAEAQRQMKSFDTTKLDADAARAQADLAKAAFEKAIANMQVLAETAQKANSEAFEIVSARMQESLNELREMAAKYGKK